MTNGRPSAAATESAVLRTCPPPSPWPPSIRIKMEPPRSPLQLALVQLLEHLDALQDILLEMLDLLLELGDTRLELVVLGLVDRHLLLETRETLLRVGEVRARRPEVVLQGGDLDSVDLDGRLEDRDPLLVLVELL